MSNKIQVGILSPLVTFKKMLDHLSVGQVNAIVKVHRHTQL
jgi:hypothetical protein